MKRCLLLSGGIDSIALCYWQRPEMAITIDYGQASAEAEIEASREVCRILAVEHVVIQADCSEVGLGNMVTEARDSKVSVPTFAPSPEWWPFRNQLLVTLAAARCVPLGYNQILIGTVKSDRQHRDGTPDFVRALSALLEYQEGGATVIAPAIEMQAAELVQRSEIPLSILCWAHSCHRSNLPCCDCRGCAKYIEVMGEFLPKWGSQTAC